ncbi:MAG: class I SAM-dependent methyltransferase [Blastocatellia bacterium]
MGEQYKTLDLADLKRSVGNYGNVVARRKGALGRFERLVKRGLRKLILRHLDQQREINQLVLSALEELVTDARARERPRASPARRNLPAWLGLAADPEYAVERNRLRQSILDRLEGCTPEGGTPAEMSGYIGEAALRFGVTIELLQQYVLGEAQGKLLEIGSNPYFLTLLLTESFPKFDRMGVNYFEGAFPPKSIQRQSVTDPRGRLSEAPFFHADIERHSLEELASFDICLFCEVLEHLPFDPAFALFNVVRTLRPGGLLLLSTPNPARLENLEKMARDRASFSDPVSGYGIHGRHNREYAANELIDLCSATGLTVLTAKTLDVMPTIYSRDAEAKGYGAYHIVLARLDESPRLNRPSWLYRSFTPERLASSASLSPA